VVSTYPSEKYEFVSWDDDIPNWMEKKIFRTTNQSTSSSFQPIRSMFEVDNSDPYTPISLVLLVKHKSLSAHLSRNPGLEGR
jgi:hypothetical protein